MSIDYQKLISAIREKTPYKAQRLFKRKYAMSTLDMWCDTRKLDKQLKKHLDSAFTIAKDQIDLLGLLIDDGFTNSQVATELSYHGYRNPSTGNMWTPNSVKVAYRKLKG